MREPRDKYATKPAKTNTKFQTPNATAWKRKPWPQMPRTLELGVWNLFGVWDLVFGVYLPDHVADQRSRSHA
jgi:hypothetical protein